MLMIEYKTYQNNHVSFVPSSFMAALVTNHIQKNTKFLIPNNFDFY